MVQSFPSFLKSGQTLRVLLRGPVLVAINWWWICPFPTLFCICLSSCYHPMLAHDHRIMRKSYMFENRMRDCLRRKHLDASQRVARASTAVRHASKTQPVGGSGLIEFPKKYQNFTFWEHT